MTFSYWDYKWSSVRHHLGIGKDRLVSDRFVSALIDDWKEFLKSDTSKGDADLLKLHERTGRPLGDKFFIEKLETLLNKPLKRKKPGPKGKSK